MFVFPVRSLLEEMGQFQPDMLTACRESVEKAGRDLTFTRLDEAAFGTAPSISIDHALMEKTQSAAVVTCEIGWSDVGSWAALWELGDKDEQGNVMLGDVVLHDVENSYIRSEGRLVSAVGVRDLVIIETNDAILIAPRDRAQEVKAIVSELDRTQRIEADLHARVYRPWGTYEGVAHGERFQVKQISVKPGGKLSLQMHHHRAEHWIVVAGTARVTNGDQELTLTENQSTYIPIGVTHRLENLGETDLTLIEVQSGSYLGEDDIVRFEDIYGRSPAPVEPDQNES
jgi:mannose-1-phosphate guanylyltransferase/mannose-6-phosphate isomerase